jgi:hypothetical protein
LIFKYYSKNPVNGKSADEILEEIWNGIETSKEFKDYLFQNEETINVALNNPSVENKVDQEIKVVAENPAIESDESESTPSTNGGPYSTAIATTVEPTKSSTTNGGPYSTAIATTVEPAESKSSTNGGPYSTTTNTENKIGGSRRIKYNKTTSLSKNKAKHSLKKTKNRKRRHNKKYTMKKYK